MPLRQKLTFLTQILVWSLVFLLGACSTPNLQPAPTTTPTAAPIGTPQPLERAAGLRGGVIPTVTLIPTPTIVPLPTPIPRKTIWIDPVLPTDIHDALVTQLTAFAKDASDPTAQVEVTTTAEADVKIGATSAITGVPLVTRTYAVAAPFPTITDSLTLDGLKRFWAGDGAALVGLAADKTTTPTLFLDADARAALVLLLGQPASSLNAQLVQTPGVLAATWAARPASFAIVPFDQLEARWKLLQLDGINLFERDANMAAYGLNLVVRASGDPNLVGQIAAKVPATTNRDVSKMAIVAMTGTTAMVRGTAVKMEQKGITYPGQKIRDWMTTADIRHVSNELSFWDQCPKPTQESGLTMCSSPKYMELLQYVGTNLIELTGNHLWDYGARLLLPTLDLYDKAGMRYFGGGRTIEDALKPLTMTVNGNKLAFIGCNYFGVDWATADTPGSAPCSPNDPKDLTYQINTIKKLRTDGYQVIATLQYEEYYFYESTPQQLRDFASLRDAGAAVVNGSQGHHVQGFDVSAAGFIHWGTGNLFFGDQTFMKGTQQTFVDRHVFYDNKYLGTDLRSAMIQDASQPRPMTPDERADLLKTLFAVSRFH